jgi:hypothetical protein
MKYLTHSRDEYSEKNKHEKHCVCLRKPYCACTIVYNSDRLSLRLLYSKRIYWYDKPGQAKGVVRICVAQFASFLLKRFVVYPLGNARSDPGIRHPCMCLVLRDNASSTLQEGTSSGHDKVTFWGEMQLAARAVTLNQCLKKKADLKQCSWGLQLNSSPAARAVTLNQYLKKSLIWKSVAEVFN